MQRRKPRKKNDFIVTELKDGISSQKLKLEDRWIFLYLLPVFIDSQPMNTVTHFAKSSSLQGRRLYWVLCKSALVNFKEWRHKHRHATRAGGTFFSINPGCRSTQWTLLNSYDNVNDATSLFGYACSEKENNLRICFPLGNVIKSSFIKVGL